MPWWVLQNVKTIIIGVFLGKPAMHPEKSNSNGRKGKRPK
jgi:hypothetical protein